MLVQAECYRCLTRLARQASSLASTEPEQSRTAYRSAISQLDRLFQPTQISIVIATAMHRVIREVTGNPDPYLVMKQREIEMAGRLAKSSYVTEYSPLSDIVGNAALGNCIDFFRSSEEIEEDLRREPHFVINDIEILFHILEGCSEILFLADNAGEAYYDLPLFKYLQRYTSVTYVVKEMPVQNDLTLADLNLMGLKEELSPVITTGTATPGIDMRQASACFISKLKTAGLIISKGMGYYESLPEYKLEIPVFYCLKAKCEPVARSLSVPLGSYVAKLVLPNHVTH